MHRFWVVAVCLAASTARADILFNNFAPNNTYLGNAGWTVINGGPVQAHIEEAATFSVTGGDFFLASLDLAVGHLFGPNTLHVFIHADDNGVPGAVIEQTTVFDQMPTMSTSPTVCPPPVHVALSRSTILEAGAWYWIHLSTDTTTGSWAAWNENIVGDVGLRAFRENGGPWMPHTGHPRGTFRVLGNPVPAPGALAAMGLGVCPLVRRRRR